MTGRPRPPTWSRPWLPTRALADKVDLQVQVAGPNAQRQIQQINAMVQAGAPGDRGLPDFADRAESRRSRTPATRACWFSPMTPTSPSPAPTTSRIDQTRSRPRNCRVAGQASLSGKGDIIVITGVPGTSVDTLRTAAAKEVFAKYPDIKIVAEAVGMWSQAVGPHRAVEDPRDPELGPDQRPVDAGRLLHRQFDAARGRKDP